MECIVYYSIARFRFSCFILNRLLRVPRYLNFCTWLTSPFSICSSILGFFLFRKTNYFLLLELMISHFFLLFFFDLFNTVSYEHLILLIFRPYKINSSIVSSSFTFIIRLIQRPGFYVQRPSANLTGTIKVFAARWERYVITFQQHYRSVLFYELPSVMDWSFFYEIDTNLSLVQGCNTETHNWTIIYFRKTIWSSRI